MGLAALGLGLRALGVGYPLEGVYGFLTFWLGVPAVFNLVHEVFGYGSLAKNLAGVGALGVWLLGHAALFFLYPRAPGVAVGLAALGYGYFGGWGAAVGLTPAFWLWAWWGARRAARFEPARRSSLKAIALFPAWLAWGQGARGQGRIVFERIPGLSREVTPQPELYYVSKNLAVFDPDLRGRPYRLEVGGMVARPLSLTLEELRALPAVEFVHALVCISNPVGGDLVGNPRWRGVLLRTLLERAGVRPEARWVVFESRPDGYVESLSLAELPAEAMVAYAIDGEDLERRHGYPTRVLIPGRYGMKQPKWLTHIWLSDTEAVGFWARRGWSRTAVVRTMSRIDVPADGASVRVGEEVVIAGIAFAGGRPLERVEVSTDGGRTWRPAVLRPPLGPYAWQLWALPWVPRTAGAHVLVVRAVEVGGRVQDPTPRRPLPDGATGYHRVRVQAVRG